MNPTTDRAVNIPFPFFHKELVARGDFKMLVLSILKERPMHGYEIARTIEKRSHGMYRPSAGAIYPALRALEDKRYVHVKSEGRRKIYSITATGKRSLQAMHARLHECLKNIREAMGPERSILMEEMQKTGRLLAIASKDITIDKAKELSKVFSEAREKMLRILSE